MTSFRPAAGEIPESPGVYRFHDDHGRVIYVGKAKNLRKRVMSYVRGANSQAARIRAMLARAETVEFIATPAGERVC